MSVSSARGGARLALVAVAALTAASCASGPGSDRAAIKQFERCRAYSGPLYSGSPSYDEWRSRLRSVARKCGISHSTVQRAMADIEQAEAPKGGDLRRVAEARMTARPLLAREMRPSVRPSRPAAQLAAAEATVGAQLAHTGDGTEDRRPKRTGKNPVRAYIDLRITPEFVEKGKELLEKHGSLLERIERKYGVPKEYIVAYWGIETNYGSFTGQHDVIKVLAKLGYGSKRRRFFAQELLASLIILDHGYAKRSQLFGSFAGAMGQPQFMPTSYLYYAVDHDRDGRRDIWRNPADIFASVANYNIKRGQWIDKHPFALTEVRLPRDFPYRLSGFHRKRPIEDWVKLGVTRTDGSPLPKLEGETAIYLPAGCEGPAFLLNGNFQAIMRYNNLIEYGFAVSVLAESIRGGWDIRKPWPENDAPLTKGERMTLQRLLSRLGHGDLVQDGMLGENTRTAIQSFQRRHNMCADGHANLDLFDRVRDRFNRVFAGKGGDREQRAEARAR